MGARLLQFDRRKQHERVVHALHQLGHYLERDGLAFEFLLRKVRDARNDILENYTPSPDNVKVYRLAHARREDPELLRILFGADFDKQRLRPGFYLALVEEIAERLSKKA